MDYRMSFKNFPPMMTCPICGTSNEGECVLVGIVGTLKNHVCKSLPVHIDCLEERLWYDESNGLVYAKCESKEAK